VKVKARDIISGWPKPRSSSCWSFDVYFFSWSPASKERLRDQAAAKAYHEGQQRMVNQYFEQYRTYDAVREWFRKGNRIAQS